jgi:fucose permease
MSPRRRLFILYFFIFTLYGIGLSIFGPCVTSIEGEFFLGHRSIGILFAAGSLGYLAGLSLGSFLTRRLPMAWTVWGGGMTQGIGLLAIAAAPNWPVIIICFVVNAFTGGVIEPAWAASMRQVFPDKARKTMNLVQVGFGIGAVCGPLIAVAVLGAGWSWRWIYAVPGAASMALIVFNPRRSAPAAVSPNKEEDTPKDSRLSEVLRNPVLWLLFLAMMFYAGGELGFSSWGSAFLEKERGFTKAGASYAGFCLWGGILIGRILMWFVSETVSSRRIIIGLSLFSAFFAVLAVQAGNSLVSLLCLAASGVGLGPLWPTIVEHGARRLRNSSSQALSFIILGGAIGAMAQAYIGHLAETTSLKTGLIFAAGLIFCIGVCLALDRLVEHIEGMRGG